LVFKCLINIEIIKKILAIFVMLLLFSGIKAQNIGIMLGGGLSTMKYNTDKDDFNSFMNDSVGFINIYHAGFNFENTPVRKKLYLQFSLQSMGKFILLLMIKNT